MAVATAIRPCARFAMPRGVQGLPASLTPGGAGFRAKISCPPGAHEMPPRPEQCSGLGGIFFCESGALSITKREFSAALRSEFASADQDRAEWAQRSSAFVGCCQRSVAAVSCCQRRAPGRAGQHSLAPSALVSAGQCRWPQIHAGQRPARRVCGAILFLQPRFDLFRMVFHELAGVF